MDLPLPGSPDEKWIAAITGLRDLLASDERAVERLHDLYLKTAMEVFGMRVGVVGTVRDGRFHFTRIRTRIPFPFGEGEACPLEDTLASTVISTGVSRASAHVGIDPDLCGHPLYRAGRFEAYLAAPIRIGTRIIGSISLLDPEPKAVDFPPIALAYIELLAETLGRAIDRNRLAAESEAAERQRNAANLLFSTAFASAPIGMALVGLDGRFLQVNAAACRLFGYDESGLLARDFQALTYPADLQSDLEQLDALMAGRISEYQLEKRYMRSDGHVVWAQLNVALVHNPDGSPLCFISQIQDIDSQKALLAELKRNKHDMEELNAKLRRLAAIDPLTGVLNRRALRERMDELMTQARRDHATIAFVMVDVDHFKAYNDRHGHVEGDTALKAIARCLRESVRASDVVGRFGGEEFLLLLPAADEKAACAMAQRICDRVRALSLASPLTVSAGVHIFRPDAAEPAATTERPVAQADAALYTAKRLGRDRVEVA